MQDKQSSSVVTLENQITERFGLLLSQAQLAELLGRSTGGLRYSLSYPSDQQTWALKACGRMIGRRVYYPATEVAQMASHLPNAELHEIDAPHGHDAFLIRVDELNDKLVDFARQGVDMGLRFGRGNYPGMRTDLLFSADQTTVSPVCSPRLLEGPNPLREPEDLRHHTLLHLDWDPEVDAVPNWRMWLLAAGLEGIDPNRGPRFSLITMVLQAAIEGHGVALAEDVIAANDVETGRLVRPFELSLSDPMNFAYYIVSPEANADHPKIAAFRDWVLREACPDLDEGTEEAASQI